MCNICLVNPITTRFLPCKHSVCCEDCAHEVQTRQRVCPICRAELQVIERGDFEETLARTREGGREEERNGRGDPRAERTCQICMSEAITTRFRPCCHSVCCEACAREVHARGHGCPVCRERLEALELGRFQGNIDRETSEVQQHIVLPFVARERVLEHEADAEVAWQLHAQEIAQQGAEGNVGFHFVERDGVLELDGDAEAAWQLMAQEIAQQRMDGAQVPWDQLGPGARRRMQQDINAEIERRGLWNRPETLSQERRQQDFFNGVLHRRGLQGEVEPNYQEMQRRGLVPTDAEREVARRAAEQADRRRREAEEARLREEREQAAWEREEAERRREDRRRWGYRPDPQLTLDREYLAARREREEAGRRRREAERARRRAERERRRAEAEQQRRQEAQEAQRQQQELERRRQGEAQRRLEERRRRDERRQAEEARQRGLGAGPGPRRPQQEAQLGNLGSRCRACGLQRAYYSLDCGCIFCHSCIGDNNEQGRRQPPRWVCQVCRAPSSTAHQIRFTDQAMRERQEQRRFLASLEEPSNNGGYGYAAFFAAGQAVT